jgi:hypothetical protein
MLKELSTVFPRMITLRQSLYHAPLGEEGVIAAVRREFAKLNLGEKIGPGKSVAIGGGSRGVASIALITRTIVEEVRKLGGEPFVFPAMGSHGGATPEGQRELLASLGMSEDYLGCPVRCTMDTVVLGTTAHGLKVYLDKYASEADAIIVANRIKPHTNFRGDIESGLMKILSIGAGKHAQAIAIHSHGSLNLRENIPAVARVILEHATVVAGFAILEDAYHNVARIEGIAPRDIFRRESELLKEVWRTLPKLPVNDIDLLIVDEIGKNISGGGMDSNVTGRVYMQDVYRWEEPDIKAVVALDLTPESHGNAIGIGMADLTVKRLAEKVDPVSTAINAITGGGPISAAIPPVCAHDREAVRIALDYLIGPVPPEQARIIRIKNTLALDTLQVSESLMRELWGRDGFSFEGELHEMSFAGDGALL